MIGLLALLAAFALSLPLAGPVAAQSLELVAGGLGGIGTADGVGSDARFGWPQSVADDGHGNLYVADQLEHTIRQIDLTSGSVTTLAGSPGMSGSADGIGSAARFSWPAGVAADEAGNVYVADTGNNTIRRIVVATGLVTTFAGSPGPPGSFDGVGTDARFFAPSGVTTDMAGNIYVADTANHLIRRIVIATREVTTIAGRAQVSGTADGVGAAARFNRPFGIASDGANDLYVADMLNHTIRRVALDTALVTTLAGSPGTPGNTDGVGGAARFYSPLGIGADGAGTLYVADSFNDAIRQIDVSSAYVTTLAGRASGLYLPSGVAVDGAGNVYVANTYSSTVRYIDVTTAEVTTLAGAAPTPGSADGVGPAARFAYPVGIAADDMGNLYVADRNNDTIRQISLSTGEVTTLAGSPGMDGGRDGIGSDARFWGPSGLALDGVGNLYVADSHNCAIRRIVVATRAVSTFAGTLQVCGSTDGIGGAARFDSVFGLTADGTGNLYVAEIGNETIRRIVISTAEVTTVAGMPGQIGSADGVGPAARFYAPSDVAADGAGNLYVTDQNNHTIRQIALATGQVTTLAGVAGIPGSRDGASTDARFNFPRSITTDGAGNLYVADLWNNTVRHLDLLTGVVSTPIGRLHSVGVQLGPLPASLNFPSWARLTPDGRLIITDGDENAVLQVK